MKFSVSNLSVQISDCPILKEVSFEFNQGESLVVMGPNGSGKTTLMKYLVGQTSSHLRALSKDYIFSDVKILERSISERGKIFSYVPQFPEVQEGLTLEKYLELSRFPFWGEANFIDEKLLKMILEKLNLGSYLMRDMSTLSGGELKKAMIAGAFYQNTPLVFLDEPFQALDPKVKSEVARFLQDWKREYGTTYIIVSHDFYWGYLLSEKNLFLKHGETVAFGDRDKVFTESNLQRTFEYPFNMIITEKGEKFFLPGGEV